VGQSVAVAHRHIVTDLNGRIAFPDATGHIFDAQPFPRPSTVFLLHLTTFLEAAEAISPRLLPFLLLDLVQWTQIELLSVLCRFRVALKGEAARHCLDCCFWVRTPKIDIDSTPRLSPPMLSGMPSCDRGHEGDGNSQQAGLDRCPGAATWEAPQPNGHGPTHLAAKNPTKQWTFRSILGLGLVRREPGACVPKDLCRTHEGTVQV